MIRKPYYHRMPKKLEMDKNGIRKSMRDETNAGYPPHTYTHL